MRRHPALAALLALLIACGPGDIRRAAPEGGSAVIGETADARDFLPPFHSEIAGRIVSELVFDPLAELGPSLNVVGDSAFAPRLAERWSWSPDSLAITFHLDPDARWHDGQPVRANDVVFAYRTIKTRENASPRAADLASVDSVVAVDSLTAVVHYARRYAEQFYHATRIVPMPAHRLDSIAPGPALRTHAEALAPVGSGRYRFVRWERKVAIELAAVPEHYRGRAKLDRLLFTITDATPGLAQVAAGEIDVWEPLTPSEITSTESNPHVRLVSGPGFVYSFLGFNLRDPRDRARPHPLFGDRALRRALTMAVDRDAVRRAAMDTLANSGLGPFVRAQMTADTTIEQIPFDRAAAEAALDSLGWTGRDTDGTRMRGRQRLAFTILYPTVSIPRTRMSVALQEQLRQVGVAVEVRGVEATSMMPDVEAGRFDAIAWAWQTSPSPTSLRGSWMSRSVPGAGATNFLSYENPAFDRAVTEGIGALDLATRKASIRRAYQQVVDDAPAIWIFEAHNLAAVHRRYDLPPWRSDAWWLTLGDWSVAPDKRLPRDARPAAP